MNSCWSSNFRGCNSESYFLRENLFALAVAFEFRSRGKVKLIKTFEMLCDKVKDSKVRVIQFLLGGIE